MSNNIKGITVEIGGNTGPLSTALKDVNKTSSSLQSELKEVNKQLKFNPSSTVLLNQKQELLAKQITATKEKLETLKEAEKQAEQQFNNGEIGEDKYRAVQREVEKTESQLKSLEKQAKETGSTLGVKFENAGTKIKSAGDKVSGVGQKLAPVSAAAAGIGVAAVKMADDFEESGSKLSTIADTSQVSMSKLENGVMQLSNETGESADSLNEALYQTISAGVKTSDSIGFLGTATKLAKGGFTDSTTAIDTLTTVINAYGLKATDATTISDQLIQTQNLGKTTVAELGTSLGNVIPIASTMGVKTQDLFASIAELTKNGIKSDEAVTGLKGALNNILSPTAEASTMAKQLGIDFSEAHLKNVGWPAFLEEIKEKTGGSSEKMASLFGNTRALNSVLTLTGKGSQDFKTIIQEMGSAAGSTDSAFAKMENNGASKWEKATNSMKNAAIKLGEALAPVMNKISALIKSIADKLSGLSNDQLNMIAKALLLTAALAPVITIGGKIIHGVGQLTDGIGKAIGAVSNFSKAMKAGQGLFTALKTAISPGGLIILGLTAIVAAAALIITHWTQIKTFFIGLWNTIKNLFSNIGTWFTSVFTSGISGIKSAWSGITGFFTGIWSAIQSAASTAWNAISSAVMAIVTPFVSAIQAPFNTLKSGLSSILNGIKSIFSGVWTIIKNVVLGIVLLFIDLITGDFTKLHSDLTGILNNIKNAFSTIWNGIKSVVTGIAKVLVGALGTIFKGGVAVLQSIGNGLKSFFSGLWDGIKSTAINMWNSLLSFFSGLPSKFSGFMQGVGNAIIHGFDSAIDFIKNLPSQMLQWGKDMIQGMIDGIKSMVGKVGDAVKGVGNKIRSVLHFSVPDEGPLVDYETWMPDFMQGLANGILNSMYKVTGAMQQVSTAMKSTISSGTQVQTAMAAAYGGYSASTSVSGDYSGQSANKSVSSPVFNQTVNNYSPKALSSAESARLTRNATKQVVKKLKG